MKTKLLIFGISGDLGTHKLLPALEQIISTGEFNDLSIIGVSRHEINALDMISCCKQKSLLQDRLSVYTMDLTNAGEYFKLKEYISLNDDEQLLVYLAVPPKAVSQIIEYLGESKINTPNVKILFEKPFGIDLQSAQEVATNTSRYYNEDQIYRIDHYLAKEMAQNIVAIRGKNALFSNIWNNNFIESIDIVAIETNDIEGRASFYEQTGALRDLVQGHLMQLLALTLMDIPADYQWDKLTELRLSALDQLKMVDSSKVVRAQYDGYKNEVGNPNSMVETFVSLEIESNQPRWIGVPIKIITGKAMSKKTSEIRVHLKKTSESQSNCLIFRIQPDEGIDIELFIKKPGYSREFETRHLSFNYPTGTELPDAYEQVIVDAISSQKSLFTSSEEVLQSWKILQPIQDEWKNSQIPLKIYSKGDDIPTVLA
ncbi:MAG: hypothetical protein WCK26_02775 [Candidatus Saccharibacteria bacterium]